MKRCLANSLVKMAFDRLDVSTTHPNPQGPRRIPSITPYIMGLDLMTAEFLLHCKRAGVTFKDSCTLGRQSVILLPSERRLAEQWSGIRLDRSAYAERFFETLGAETPHSMDASGYEGADIIHNLNEVVPPSLVDRFDCLVDGGTLEHIFDFPKALNSCLRMVRPGGHLIICNVANNHMGHGFYQFSPELFYSAFRPENGCRIRFLYLNENGTWFRPLDPGLVNHRVEARTRGFTRIYVCVERISSIVPFLVPPHQSDYRFNLPGGDLPIPESNGAGAGTFRQKIKRHFPQIGKLLAWWHQYKRDVLYPASPIFEELDRRWDRFKQRRSRSLRNKSSFEAIGKRLL